MVIAEHSLETSTAPAALWARMTDVAAWPEWMVGLASAEGFLEAASSLVLRDQAGTRRSFLIQRVESGRSFHLEARLPLARMRFACGVEPSPMGSKLSARWETEGALAWFALARFGTRMKRDLPLSLRKLARPPAGPAVQP
jgi:hypothetical protein